MDCFFFAHEEIEFDLDPRDFQGNIAHQQIARLLDFLRAVGQLLNKTVVLTPENDSLSPLFRCDPQTGEERWSWENIEELYQRANSKDW